MAGFAKTAVGLHKHLKEGEIWGRLLHSSPLFLTERNSCELHTEDEVNKSSDAQRHSTANIQMHFPHHECRRHSNPPRLSAPDSARGNWGLCMQRSLDQMLPTMCNSLQSKECDSSPLTPSACHYWLLHTALWSFSNLCTPGKRAALISDRQAFLGSAAGAFANCAGAVDLL